MIFWGFGIGPNLHGYIIKYKKIVPFNNKQNHIKGLI